VLFLALFFELPAVLYLLFWFLSQVFSGTFAGLGPEDVGGVAWWAHVGGFAAGMLLHRLFCVRWRGAPRRFERDAYGVEGAWMR
jgi:membrane associated rhomboid family serine protease